MLYIPILGALALAGTTIMERIVLKTRKINIRPFQTFTFLASVIVMLPLIYFFWKADSQAFELKNILIFLLVIIFSMAANLFAFYSLKWEKVTHLEPARMLEPLFVVTLAIFFSFFSGLYERNLNVIIPSLIAASALVFSHIKKHHLEFNKYFLAAIAGSLFFALELIVSRLILNYYNPLSFYFLRCSSIFLISIILFRPKLSNLKGRIKYEIFGIGILWVVYRLIVYYGYLHYGVIFTTLIIMLGPVFIYLFAWKFLKEKLELRNIVAAVVIVGCVLYAMIG
ncbi:MAG: DMT family transporter [Nanoarchaeota archaeon]